MNKKKLSNLTISCLSLTILCYLLYLVLYIVFQGIANSATNNIDTTLIKIQSTNIINYILAFLVIAKRPFLLATIIGLFKDFFAKKASAKKILSTCSIILLILPVIMYIVMFIIAFIKVNNTISGM